MNVIPIFLATIILAASTLVAGAEAPQAGPLKKTWNFSGGLGKDWVRESEALARPKAVKASKGTIRIMTRAGTWDRMKITTKDRSFGPGTYTWRVHVPKMGMGDMASAGAFLYRDDTHEVDFEIGYGKASDRQRLKTAADEVICWCTNQASPFDSTGFNIKPNSWYTLTIKLVPSPDGNLLFQWFVNGRKLRELPSQIPAATRFGIHCSVENLKFIGDHQPKKNHTAIFDKVVFSSSDP